MPDKQPKPRRKPQQSLEALSKESKRLREQAAELIRRMREIQSKITEARAIDEDRKARRAKGD